MGSHEFDPEQGQEELRVFMRHILADLRALSELIDKGLVEEGVRRIGAEQELFLVDESWRPHNRSIDILDKIKDTRFTTELAQFNLEFNLDPQIFGGSCLKNLENDLNSGIEQARKVAKRCGTEIALTGILPTIRHSDLTMENITPKPRYYALDQALTRLRGGREFELRVLGADELLLKHDSVMLEACNTSFQIHFQVSPSEFARIYNIAQATAAPLLAVATNSPILFGKRLWSETRIAIFQQTLDTRQRDAGMLERQTRVRFGSNWVNDSILEIFQEDISRMRILLGGAVEEDRFEAIRQGKAPKLQALQMYNGTVYRWIRPCYGITDGVPHIRIENRFLPSGPSVVDEVANAALWFGLISGMMTVCPDIRDCISFDSVRSNFTSAARDGLSAQFEWTKNRTIPARELLLKELIPMAREGLRTSEIDGCDIDYYLGIIEDRVKSEQTGSAWVHRSLVNINNEGTPYERSAALTAATVRNQHQGKPVHDWPPATLDDAGDWERNYLLVNQYMTTDVYTVHEAELVDLVACLMDWAHIRHVPVEDDDGNFVGLVGYRSLLRILAQGQAEHSETTVPVKQIMTKHPKTITPDTRTLDAIRLMRREQVACLPVVKDNKLMGIITERDFMSVAADLLDEKLRDI